jgi:hypothetical protein
MARVRIDPAVPDRASLDSEIARQRGLDVGELRARWHTVFRRRAQTSNKIIQKGLAFVRERSGSVTVPGTWRASGSCPAGCMATAGLWWWRQRRRRNPTEDPDVKTHR